MQQILLFTILLICLFSFTAAAQELPEYYVENASEFTLKIEGLNKTKGEIRIAMFSSEEKYTKEPVYAVVLPVNKDIVEWKIPDLPYGEYAIAVYHDVNTNGKLDTNLLGIPKESYGFSNNVRGRFGPASWNDAKFKIDKNSSEHLIQIK